MKTAGWIAMVSAFASLPVAYLTWKLEGQAAMAQTAVQIAAVVIFVAITVYLKKLLNSRFHFRDTDSCIGWMIKSNVTAALLTIVGLHYAPFRETLGVAALLLIVFQGVVQVRFGYKLLKLQDDLGGILRPYCYANMVTGVCVASVILILVGICVSAIADLMLGTIFFNLAAATAPEADQSP